MVNPALRIKLPFKVSRNQGGKLVIIKSRVPTRKPIQKANPNHVRKPVFEVETFLEPIVEKVVLLDIDMDRRRFPQFDAEMCELEKRHAEEIDLLMKNFAAETAINKVNWDVRQNQLISAYYTRFQDPKVKDDEEEKSSLMRSCEIESTRNYYIWLRYHGQQEDRYKSEAQRIRSCQIDEINSLWARYKG